MPSRGVKSVSLKNAVGPLMSRLSQLYFVAPEHPSKVRMWRWLRKLQRNRPFVVRYCGVGWLAVGERCLVQRSIFTTGEYEREVSATLLGCAEVDEVLWDVGANIGAVSVLARLDERVAHLVSVEPDEGNRSLLELNLAMNPGGCYEILSFALSSEPGQATWTPAPEMNKGMAHLGGPRSEGVTEAAVQCETIDRLVFDRGLLPPTLLKLDVEGAELLVLRGASRLLRERPPKAIVFEAQCSSPGQIADPDVPDLLLSRGYTIRPILRPKTSIDAQENFLAVLTHRPQKGTTSQRDALCTDD